jgi:Domain of unknown function (DUF4349)
MSVVDLEAILRGEPGDGVEEQRLAEVVALVRAQPPVAPEQLRTRVAQAAPPQRARFALPRRAPLIALAALLALAVLAAIVHGLVGSTSTTRSSEKSAAATTVPQLAPHTSAGGGSGAAARERQIPAWGRATAAPAPPFQQSLGRIHSPSLTGGSRAQHVDASLRVRVSNVDKLGNATADATRIARSLGGYALSVRYRTPAGRPGQAFLELRVPTTKVQQAIARLGGLGTLVSQQLFVQDLQRDLDRENAQILQLREAVAAYTAALKDPSLTPVQRVQLQLKLAETKRALSQRVHKRGSTLAEAALSRVSLVLTTAHAAQPATHHSSGFGRRLGSAVAFLGLEATIALYALIVASPFLVLGGLAWAAARVRRRRDEERLLAA